MSPFCSEGPGEIYGNEDYHLGFKSGKNRRLL